MAVVFVAVVVILIMAMLGFRITYAPELENDWEAISAVASWVGVLASFLAIWYAIQVPKTIADRQDKIALFEKRYECFLFFEECFELFRLSLKKNADNEIIGQVCIMLDIQAMEDLNKYIFENKLRRFEFLIHQMAFLFPKVKENDVMKLYYALSLYLFAIWKQKNIEETKRKYMDAMAKFREYSNEIWDSMTISESKNT